MLDEKPVAPARPERRLAAIFAADVAGYSRLMNIDEVGTTRTLSDYRQIMDSKISDYNGRIANTAGDSVLAEFASVVDAVECAAEIQKTFIALTADIPLDAAILFRIGIHIGDVILRGADLLGDGVNIAARLESIAKPGGVTISASAYDHVQERGDFVFESQGPQSLKNISKPIHTYTLVFASGSVSTARATNVIVDQTIKYCRSADGVRLAYSIIGNGPPLVKSANWLNHLQLDFELPLLSHLITGLAANRTLVRYDARGNGMSDWDASEISLERWVDDLEAVMDAAGLASAPIFGISQGCAVSIAFANRYPDRVSKLILYGGFATGRMKRATLTETDKERFNAIKTLLRIGWGTDDPTFRQLLTSQLMPTATLEQTQAFNDLQRRSASPECAVRYLETVNNFDVKDILSSISVPTLVLHARDDLMVPIAEGRAMAAAIPGAKFVSIPGKNHVPLENDPGMEQFWEEIAAFLSRSS